MLTKKQKQILDFITSFITDNGYSPSYQEIADHFQLNSKATVFQHIQALQTKGMLNSDTTIGARNLVPVQPQQENHWSDAIELPLAGLIAAGEPIEAIEMNETIAIPQSFVLNPSDSYVLRVKGESMIDEGILNGDYVVIERNPSPRNGDVVVALLNNQYATLKKFYREPNRIRLQPANKTLKPLYVKDPLIQGIVRAVIRRFQTI